jgi:hydrogenase/urease accessory protein HupE
MEADTAIGVLTAIMFLAFLTEGMTEYMFGKWEQMKASIPYIALAFGIVLAIAYDINIPAMVGLTAKFSLISNIVSGVIIGRGSNFTNDIISRVRGERKTEVQ